MTLWKRLLLRSAPARQRAAELLLGAPKGCEGRLMSMIVPQVRTLNESEEHLCLRSLDWAREAASTGLGEVSRRIRHGVRLPDIWPGEHYRLLAGMIKSMRPNRIVEFGTFTGRSEERRVGKECRL